MLHWSRTRRLALAALVLCVLAGGGAVLAFGDPDRPAAAAAASSHAPARAKACGAAGPLQVAAVQDLVARRIYADELHGRETREDVARVRSYLPLLRALEGHETQAVREAVHALVYMPRWHIVRLRVLDGSRLLADVGGPHVTAPVTGVLRAHGRTLARYVMSVQDDLGVQKLVTRFTGAPIDFYQHGAYLMGTLTPAPPMPADGARVQVAGRSWIVRNASLQAFPSGALQASIFVPAGPAGSSCSAVRVAAWGSVAQHIAQRLQPLSGAHLQDLADVVQSVTGGRIFVRGGGHRLVGAGPAQIPTSGTVRYGGSSWPVYTWQPTTASPPGARVYFLTPPG